MHLGAGVCYCLGRYKEAELLFGETLQAEIVLA